MFSRTCLGKAVPWVSGLSALLAGIFFLVEGTAGYGAIKLEKLPLSVSWARNGTEQISTQWVHWTLCHELSYVKRSCTLKIFCLDTEHAVKGCTDAGAGPFAAGVLSCIIGIGLLPLPLGYMNASNKTHVIILVSISGFAWLFGCISFAIVAAEHARVGSDIEDLIKKHVPDVNFERKWGGGLYLLLFAWILSWLVLIPTILWLVFFTPLQPSKTAIAADRRWQNVGLRQAPPAAMMYQEPQRPAAPLNLPANNQPYGSKPVVPKPYGQPAPQGNWTAAAPKPNAPIATNYGGPAALRTSHKMPTPVQVEANAQSGPWTNSTE